jgi:hypothetical protein
VQQSPADVLSFGKLASSAHADSDRASRRPSFMMKVIGERALARVFP